MPKIPNVAHTQYQVANVARALSSLAVPRYVFRVTCDPLRTPRSRPHDGVISQMAATPPLAPGAPTPPTRVLYDIVFTFIKTSPQITFRRTNDGLPVAPCKTSRGENCCKMKLSRSHTHRLGYRDNQSRLKYIYNYGTKYNLRYKLECRKGRDLKVDDSNPKKQSYWVRGFDYYNFKIHHSNYRG